MHVEYELGGNVYTSPSFQLPGQSATEWYETELTGLEPGYYYQYRVVAQSAGGTTSSAQREFFTRIQPPKIISPPTLKSTQAEVGVPLEAVSGRYTNPPYKLSNHWGRCNSYGFECKNISGAEGYTYVPTEADIGHTLWFIQGASNTGGSVSAGTNHTSVVK